MNRCVDGQTVLCPPRPKRNPLASERRGWSSHIIEHFNISPSCFASTTSAFTQNQQNTSLTLVRINGWTLKCKIASRETPGFRLPKRGFPPLPSPAEPATGKLAILGAPTSASVASSSSGALRKGRGLLGLVRGKKMIETRHVEVSSHFLGLWEPERPLTASQKLGSGRLPHLGLESKYSHLTSAVKKAAVGGCSLVAPNSHSVNQKTMQTWVSHVASELAELAAKEVQSVCLPLRSSSSPRTWEGSQLAATGQPAKQDQSLWLRFKLPAKWVHGAAHVAKHHKLQQMVATESARSGNMTSKEWGAFVECMQKGWPSQCSKDSQHLP